MEKLYLQVKEVTPVTPTIEEFLTYHKMLREANETVLLMGSPRRWGDIECVKQRKNGGVKLFYYAKGWTQERKLLKSKSKQSRLISVVCK